MLYASVKEQLKITFFRSKQDVFKYRASPDDMCNKLQARLIHMHFQLIYGAKIFIFDYRISNHTTCRLHRFDLRLCPSCACSAVIS